MNNQNPIDPAWTIIDELDPTGLTRLLYDFRNHTREFNEEVHMLVLMSLEVNINGIKSWEERQIAEINQRAGGNFSSERYGEELEEIELIAGRQSQFAYNLVFTGLMDVIACRFTKIAWEIDDMAKYLPLEADKDDPRSLIADLLKWPNGEKLDLKKIDAFDMSGGRLEAAREARNLLVHPKRPVFDSSGLSEKQECVRAHMPEMLNEDGYIQANANRIRQVAEDAEVLIQRIVDKHEHGWLMLLHASLSR